MDRKDECKEGRQKKDGHWSTKQVLKKQKPNKNRKDRRQTES